jgi:UDP-N-acetylmuramate--alanine ligase
MKTKIGIFFSGFSREREISFAGGRTVYDNLDKSLFEAIPIFVDSFGQFIELNWQYIYKGSIRDFYPQIEFLPETPNHFQVYAESIDREIATSIEFTANLGKKLNIEEIKNKIDFAFLCLHGAYGEDGKLQGLLDYYQIPFSGSGILPSAIGINKAVQKQLMKNAGFPCPKFIVFEKDSFLQNPKEIYQKAQKEVGFPLVVKAANQGSSIGISVLSEDNENAFYQAVNHSLFKKVLQQSTWNVLNYEQQVAWVRQISDIREGLGLPLLAGGKEIYHPEDLLKFLNDYLTNNEEVVLEAFDSETEIVVEQFIDGKEFSCIVVENEKEGTSVTSPLALPPTEIRKGKEMFDYRSKYLPGLSRKITPIELPDEQIEKIRKACESLFEALKFNVYARIDGFITSNGDVFLNDPNTTSGMLPSSFFFHQAAEIGLNPSQFLTYIIRTSINARFKESGNNNYKRLLNALDENINAKANAISDKKKVAVILGGYSSERHISVESGRNVYEKLSSSDKYEPIPVFLTGSSEAFFMYQIPINVLLKDNADDIKEKIAHFHVHPIINQIIEKANYISKKYTGASSIFKPIELGFEELANLVDLVFIALHGRPGEDGAIQKELEKVGLPYNGSGSESSQITINKFETNRILKENGFLAAGHTLVNQEIWESNPNAEIARIESNFKYPIIAKPVDDGCSSAVKKIKNREELIAFSELIFRNTEILPEKSAQFLGIKQKEEFPIKKQYLIEDLIAANGADLFIEITGGMLSHFNEKGEHFYEVFEASEALTEGDVLSLEEKFLAGEGQNITPARYHKDAATRDKISEQIKNTFAEAAKLLKVEGYCRIDAFVRVYNPDKVEVLFIEFNSLPGMTPATCIFHQTAINGYKPYEFIDGILSFGEKRAGK